MRHFFAAVVATVPYLVLKLLWLTGSKIGTTDRTAPDELSSTRFVAGNSITVLLMVVAAVFVVALTRSWANRRARPLVFVLAAGATGLLAPILVGLPVGLAVQAVARGDVGPAEDTGMAPWVFAVVYCGFGLLGSRDGGPGHRSRARPMGLADLTAAPATLVAVHRWPAR